MSRGLGDVYKRQAVTRAKEMVVLIGDKDNVAKMVRNNYTQKRYSMLKDFIIEENSRRC